MRIPKITDIDALDWAKKHIEADYKDGIKMQLGSASSPERIELYRKAFNDLAKNKSGHDLDKFIMFGQLNEIILPEFARKTS